MRAGKDHSVFRGGIRRIVLLLIAVVLLPVLVLQATTHIGRYRTAVEREKQTDLELARAVGLAFQAYFADILRQEAGMGEALTSLPSFPTDQTNHFLTANAAEYPSVRAFHWASPQGSIIASSDPQFIGLKIGDQEYFRAILGGRPWVLGDLVQDRPRSQPAFLIARGVRDHAGLLQGVVIADIEPQQLGVLALDFERADSGRISIFDRQGMLVYRRPEAALTFEQRNWRNKDPLLAQALAGSEATGIIVSPADGQENIAARVPLKDTGWVMGASRPAAKVMAPLVRGLMLDLGILGAIATASILVALAISRRISQPAQHLQAQAMAIGRGDLDHRTQVTGVAELEVLGEAFNRMAAGLKQAREESQNVNTALEQRVRERSAEWQAANESLRMEIAERQEAEHRTAVTHALLERFARKGTRKEYLDAAVEVLRNWTGCRCVGIRVVDPQQRIPYESFVGFSREFWQRENWLSLDTDTCACVRVIRRTPEPQDAAVLTPRGSFRCDNALGFVRQLSPEAQARFRGVCVQSGFKSIAVVPISQGEQTLGAIHLADEREGMVPLAKIEFLESMALLIGEALHRFNTEEELRRYREHLEELVQQRTAQLEAANRKLQREMAEREQAEAQIHLLARFPAENPNPVCRIDARMTLSYCNAASEPLLAVWQCRVGQPAPEKIQEMVRGVTASGRPAEIEYAAGHRIFSLVFAPVPDAGYVNVYGRDVTKRRRAEEALRETLEELARSNKDLEQFAYVASHDLQEPLRIVTGYLQLLERRYKDRLDSNAFEFIDFAVDGAKRMQSLISDLLLYSQVGRQDRRPAPADSQAVLDKALANLRTAIEESGAAVTHDPLPTVTADAAQLVQVFQNLIGNALKFRGDQPPQIHVGARRENGHWLFWVKDNGIGFEPQYADRIFVIFQRLHTRDKYPGTGIGLAICKKIIERHGGRIWVESMPGQGATFYFTLTR